MSGSQQSPRGTASNTSVFAAPDGRKRLPARTLMLILAPFVVLFLFLVAWAIDTALNTDEIRRNVSVAGVEVGGLTRDDAAITLGALDRDFRTTPVILQAGQETVVTTVGAFGFSLDVDASLDRAMDVGRDGTISRPFTWVGGLLGDETIDAEVLVDEAWDASALASLLPTAQEEPVQPRFVLEDGEVTVVPGVAGLAYDPSGVRDAVLAQARTGSEDITVTVPTTSFPPPLSDNAARSWADELNVRTAGRLTVSLDGEERFIEPELLRSWLEFPDYVEEPVWELNATLVDTDLVELFSDSVLGSPPEIAVVDGRPTVIGGESTVVCCGDDSADLLQQALFAGDPTITLTSGEADAEATQTMLEEMGIIELLSSSTTYHACCEGRVTNIQRMAELVRGAIIEPGDTFSLNGHVGQRTIEKGFVEGGVIYFGEFQADVGGGVSQFATTLFNASFYGGLDFGTYQAHTIWIPRYPYGIEATVSWPAPDLEIVNNSDYGVLIWPTWTADSITVELYSTDHVDSVVLAQWNTPDGQCTIVTTQRERSFDDGRTEVDQITAWYQPGDGIGCDGEPTNPDNRTDPTTATPVPSPTPEPSPDPSPTVEAETTPDPVPTATLPASTATPVPTAEPTGDPVPTVGVTPDPDPTAEPTASPPPTAEPTTDPTPTPSPTPTTEALPN